MKDLVVLDLEVYPNYTLFAFKNIDNGKTITIELKDFSDSLTEAQHKKLNTIMHKRTTFGFNSRNYDMPIILYALKGKTANEIHQLSTYIIEENSIGWMTMQKFGLSIPNKVKHFDIQEVAPGVMVSLKLYGGRMNSKKLQDLPIEPNSVLSDEEMEETKLYCINDLDTTIDLYNKIKDRVDLRRDMSKQYGQDLMSKSDAQIAEIIIKSGLERKVYPPKLPEGSTFKYVAPDFIKFKTKELQEVLERIHQCDFELNKGGSVMLPKEISKNKIELGKSTYTLGIGGLHSNEKKQSIIPKDNQLLIDKDVASYYPMIILNNNLYPKHLGEKFLDVYRNIVKERLKAKKEGNKIVNESLKIVINGSFGKFGSKWSSLYSPDLMIAVTITGQLSLLMLIEELEDQGISVVSANTDGFVSLLDKSQKELYENACFDWQLNTGFMLEATNYDALYSRDVNNYLAISGNKLKGKGIFTVDSLSKNPQAPVCVKAVMEYLHKGKCIDESIRDCKDLTQFLTIRTVAGGAVFRGKYLGRVVRWIYSTDGDTINYKKNGNKVAKSDGARPIMELGDLPDDIDFDRYIEEARSILEDLGIN